MNRPALLRCLLTVSLMVSTVFGISPFSAAQTPQRSEETIVLIRHGEKPPGGLGQLTCKGLNRALALPAVLIGRFGKPDYIYAPNPSMQVNDGNSQPTYSYLSQRGRVFARLCRGHPQYPR